MADPRATGGSGSAAARGNGIAHREADTGASAGTARTGTVTDRGLPAAVAPPPIVRPAPPGLVPPPRNKGDVGAQKARAKARRVAAPDVAPEASKRNAASAIQSAHNDAATMLGIPELELSAAEAQRVAGAFDKTRALTGFDGTGPMWDWLYIAYVLACVYVRRAFDIIARRRAEAATAAESATAPARPVSPAPAAPLAGPLPASIAPIARTSAELIAPTAELKPAGATNHPAAAPVTQESIAAALAQAAGRVAGFEKREAGLPVSSIDERLAGI